MNIRELITLLKTAESAADLDARQEEIASVIPKVRIMYGFDQQDRGHQYDLWHHTAHTVLNLESVTDDILYLAALLHDIGKPDCQVRGKDPDDPYMHYFGHPVRSMEIVRDEVIPGLRESGNALLPDEERRLLYYVEHHDDPADLAGEHMRSHLDIPVTLEEYKDLMRLEVADAWAHKMIPIVVERLRICRPLCGSCADDLYKKIRSETNTF